MSTVIDTIAIITLTVRITILLSPSPTPPSLPALPCHDITILAVFSVTATSIFVTTESLSLTSPQSPLPCSHLPITCPPPTYAC